jgi:hypothetical protein
MSDPVDAVRQALSRALEKPPEEGAAGAAAGAAAGVRPSNKQLLSMAWRCAHEAGRRAVRKWEPPPMADDYEAESLSPDRGVGKWKLPQTVTDAEGKAARDYASKYVGMLDSLTRKGVDDDFLSQPLGVGGVDCAICLVCPANAPGRLIGQQLKCKHERV